MYQALQRFTVLDLSNFYLDVAKDRLYINGSSAGGAARLTSIAEGQSNECVCFICTCGQALAALRQRGWDFLNSTLPRVLQRTRLPDRLTPPRPPF